MIGYKKCCMLNGKDNLSFKKTREEWNMNNYESGKTNYLDSLTVSENYTKDKKSYLLVLIIFILSKSVITVSKYHVYENEKLPNNCKIISRIW